MPAMGSKTSVQERCLLHFYVYGRAYAIDIHRIQEIIYSRQTTPVPMAAGFILGIIDLRGQIVPVISLRERLGLAAGSEKLTAAVAEAVRSPHADNKPQSGDLDCDIDKRNSHILIVRVGNRIAGLIVDGVHEVVKIPNDSIHSPDRMFANAACKYLSGIFHVSDQLILLLDVDQLFSLDDLKALDHLA